MLKIFVSLVVLVVFMFAGVNINEATQKELTKLKGIGTVTADAIIEYRKNHGDFKSVDDLVKVKGVGSKTIEKNIDNIIVKNSNINRK